MGHNSGKIKWFFFLIYSGNLLIIPYQLTKFQGPSLRLIEPLNYFETHYWRFRQTYFFWKQPTVRSLQSK